MGVLSEMRNLFDWFFYDIDSPQASAIEIQDSGMDVTSQNIKLVKVLPYTHRQRE
jgi:hypothetical protein